MAKTRVEKEKKALILNENQIHAYNKELKELNITDLKKEAKKLNIKDLKNFKSNPDDMDKLIEAILLVESQNSIF